MLLFNLMLLYQQQAIYKWDKEKKGCDKDYLVNFDIVDCRKS